jgi:hypothetical protein
MVESVKGGSVQLLTNTRGQLWTKCGFKAKLQKALRGNAADKRAPDEFQGHRMSAGTAARRRKKLPLLASRTTRTRASIQRRRTWSGSSYSRNASKPLLAFKQLPHG